MHVLHAAMASAKTFPPICLPAFMHVAYRCRDTRRYCHECYHCLPGILHKVASPAECLPPLLQVRCQSWCTVASMLGQQLTLRTSSSWWLTSRAQPGVGACLCG